jgi:hypothetical protein
MRYYWLLAGGRTFERRFAAMLGWGSRYCRYRRERSMVVRSAAKSVPSGLE